jgi:hypothetical protein
VLQVLEELSPDLNGLTIFTERPAYFRDYVEKMYEETGLLVQLRKKSCLYPGEGYRKLVSNVVLDFERQGRFYQLELSKPALYVPVYKKPWKTVENLDICVPIGYNTVIARGIGEI